MDRFVPPPPPPPVPLDEIEFLHRDDDPVANNNGGEGTSGEGDTGAGVSGLDENETGDEAADVTASSEDPSEVPTIASEAVDGGVEGSGGGEESADSSEGPDDMPAMLHAVLDRCVVLVQEWSEVEPVSTFAADLVEFVRVGFPTLKVTDLVAVLVDIVPRLMGYASEGATVVLRSLASAVPSPPPVCHAPIHDLSTSYPFVARAGYLSHDPGRLLSSLVSFMTTAVENGVQPFEFVGTYLPNLFGPVFGIGKVCHSCLRCHLAILFHLVIVLLSHSLSLPPFFDVLRVLSRRGCCTGCWSMASWR